MRRCVVLTAYPRPHCRPHRPCLLQVDAIRSIIRSWKGGNNAQMVMLPTGCGKTVVFSGEAAVPACKSTHTVVASACLRPTYLQTCRAISHTAMCLLPTPAVCLPACSAVTVHVRALRRPSACLGHSDTRHRRQQQLSTISTISRWWVSAGAWQPGSRSGSHWRRPGRSF